MATRTKWFRDLPLKEVRKADGSVHLGSPIIWVASSPAALEANGRVLLDPRGGEWLKDTHRPETWEVGLERTQQVWVAESWWLGWEEERKPSQLEGLHWDPPGAESYCQCSSEMGRVEAISFFFIPYHPSERGLPRWLRVKNLAPSAGSLSSIPGLGSSPEKEMTTHSSILACKSYGLRSLGATVHGVV